MSALHHLGNVTPLRPRAARIEHGDLVDCSRRAASIGFAVPVAFTRDAYTAVGPALDEVLWLLFLAAASLGAPGRDRVLIPTAYATLLLLVEPGDTGETTLTVALHTGEEADR